MLMRTEVKEKENLEERQLVAEAAIQSQKALFAAKKAVRKTDHFTWVQSHVTEEDVWNGELDWKNKKGKSKKKKKKKRKKVVPSTTPKTLFFSL